MSTPPPKVSLTTSGYAKVPPATTFKINTGLTLDEVRRESVTLLWGPSGIGKTTVSRHWPNPLFLMMTGGGEHRPLPLLDRNIPFIDVDGKGMMDTIVAELLKDGGLTKLIPGYEIKSVILDQLPTWYAMQTSQVLTIPRTRENSETMAQGDFRQLRRRAHLWVNDLTRLPIHKVYLATDRVERPYNPGGAPSAPTNVGPDLSESLVNDFMRYSDFVLYMTMERFQQGTTVGYRRVFHTQPGEIPVGSVLVPFSAKDSSQRLPAKIISTGPDFNLFESMMIHLAMESPNAKL